jgi:putative protease
MVSDKGYTRYSLRPELLSPAGDFESLQAAVINGADAVYLGLDGFNARSRPATFMEEIKKAWATATASG